MPPLCVMIKPASGLCNMRCGYCFYADEMGKRAKSSYGIMTEETLECTIREILRFAEGECTIAFQGGEPTLAGLPFFEKCLELEERYNVNHVRISHSLQTNGYGLNQEWCRFFASHHFLLGLSIDGILSTHDAYRKDPEGKGTYLKILEAARMLEDAGVDFNVLTVVNRRTAPKIRHIYEQYRKLGFRWQQYIACLDPLGEKPGGQEYSLLPETYGQFLIDLFDLWYLDFREGKAPYIRQFENAIGLLMGHVPESCEQRGTCSSQSVIEADGSVYPCDFYVLDEYRLGNLRVDSFEALAKRRKELRFVESSFNHTPECKQCRYHPVCRGGCRRHRDQPGQENYFCRSYRMFYDACLPRMLEIARAFQRK